VFSDSAESQEDITQVRTKNSSTNGTGDHKNKMTSSNQLGNARKSDNLSSSGRMKKVAASGSVLQDMESNGGSQGDYYALRVAPLLEEIQNIDAGN